MANKGIKGFKIEGLKEVYKDLQLTEEEIIKAALKGQKILAQNILGESKKLCPVKSGTLRRSGDIKTEGNITTIFYNTPYALKQHEDASLKHTEGEAKYLERPFNEKAGKLESYIQTEVYKAMRRNYPS